jgi:glycosyltransferase involved in cell wall biosynthesis
MDDRSELAVSSTTAPGLRRISLILATYERADALELLLRALADQDDDSDFEVVVADDGSGPEVAATVERWRERLDIRHVWQPNEGFRKTRVMNLGVLAASGDYLLFLDADCLPRTKFLRAIRRAALAGWYLGTKRLDLGESFSRMVLDQRIPIWRWTTLTWLVRGRGEVHRPGFFLPLRDRRRPWNPEEPDFYPPDNAHGFCLGVHRSDYERINGYDMRYTGRANEDTDIALRLDRSGLRCGWPGPNATMFHLWHTRPADRPNEAMFFETRDSERVEAVVGLRELAAEVDQVSA